MSKHNRRASRPGRKKSRNAAAKSSSEGADTYSGFGHLGPEFEGLRIQRRRMAEAEWKKARRAQAKLLGSLPKSYWDAFSRNVTMARYFLLQLLVCSARRDKDVAKELRSSVIHLWDSVIQHCFSPSLGSAAEVFPSRDIERRCGLIVQCYSAAVRQTDRQFDLTKLCYGPFSQRQMQYVVANDPRIIEAGCGSGYCLERLAETGLDVIGFDENLYGLSDGSESESTKALVEAGKILLADQSELPDSVFEGRTLLISWPICAVPYAVEVLERFSKLGGERFLLKFGGFLAFSSRSGLGVISRFFQTLRESWKQVGGDTVPAFQTRMLENNLFVYERR